MEYEFPSPAGQYREQIIEDSCEQFAADEQPISGSGLYPLLSLANHDCNPNSSIEFLQESNRGAMVATRNISVGEEIVVTYVCNGAVGNGDGAEYFRHFSPTRTWKWLNDKLNNEEDEEEEDEDEELDDPDLHDDSAVLMKAVLLLITRANTNKIMILTIRVFWKGRWSKKEPNLCLSTALL